VIWGRSTANDTRTCLHVPLKHTGGAVTGLYTRPMPSVTAPINRVGDANSKATEITVIRILTRHHAPSTASSLLAHTPPCLSQLHLWPCQSIDQAPQGSRYASNSTIGPSTRLHAPFEVSSSLIHAPTRHPLPRVSCTRLLCFCATSTFPTWTKFVNPANWIRPGSLHFESSKQPAHTC
jgi:hypothetical protein